MGIQVGLPPLFYNGKEVSYQMTPSMEIPETYHIRFTFGAWVSSRITVTHHEFASKKLNDLGAYLVGLLPEADKRVMDGGSHEG